MTELAHDQRPETWTPVAAGYEASFAPITGGYADALLDQVGIEPGEQVLDVAAGSGAFSLRAARLGAEVTATDFAPGMVEHLRRRFAEEHLDRCDAAVMDGQALDLPDGLFDLSVSMFGVIFFPDIDKGLRELARVTRQAGRVCVSTWRVESFRLTELVQAALTRAVPGFQAPQGEPVWARIGDADGLRGALAAAGLDPVEVLVVTRPWAWDDPAAFFRSLPNWSPPSQPLFAALDPALLDAAAAAFVEVVADAAGSSGTIDVDALIGIGTKP